VLLKKWSQKMFILSRIYEQSVIKWDQRNKHLSEFYPQDGGKKAVGIEEMEQNYVTVALCLSHPEFVKFLQSGGTAVNGAWWYEVKAVLWLDLGLPPAAVNGTRAHPLQSRFTLLQRRSKVK